MTLEERLERALTEAETGWNMGSFGAIAEFHHVDGDEMPVPPAPLTQVTARGGLRIDRLDGVRPIAWEMLSPKSHRWSHGISLCLPEAEATMHQRTVLTSLGADIGALRAADCDAELFDMGLGQIQVDFCIRTADPELRSLLHAAEGRSLFEADNPAMSAILAAHPARVALTRLGRVEVYQKIGGPDTGGISPEGPHTHVLPKLLRADRTHSANTPIPKGWVPCAGVHPANPVADRMGRDKDFDATDFEDFQKILSAWGLPDYTQTKAAVWAALDAQQDPESFTNQKTRLERVALRNALRQRMRQTPDDTLLHAWRSTFDKGEDEGEELLSKGHVISGEVRSSLS